MNQDWIVVEHPRPRFELSARERWKMEHRLERMKRKGIAPEAFTVQVGTWEGFRFVE